MNQSKLHALRERLDATHEQYSLHFAGQMRVTRSPQMIEAMIEEAGAIGAEASAIQANGDAELRRSVLKIANERLDLYRAERDAIAEAQGAAGDDGIEAAVLGTRANFIQHRYRRQFAGFSRSTRDLGLLREMITDTRAVLAQLGRLPPEVGSVTHDTQVISDHLDLLDREVGHIRAARDAGTLDEQAGTLATIANGQFELYRIHFAGQPRISRRPELLERMIDTLASVLERMQALVAIGHHDEHNAENIQVVTGRITAWRAELAEVRAAREATPMLTTVDALGDAVDVVLQVYNERFAGQDRRHRDLALLAGLIDRLDELERQMETISHARTLTVNERGLALVRDALVMLGQEWDACAEAQAEAAPST